MVYWTWLIFVFGAAFILGCMVMYHFLVWALKRRVQNIPEKLKSKFVELLKELGIDE